MATMKQKLELQKQPARLVVSWLDREFGAIAQEIAQVNYTVALSHYIAYIFLFSNLSVGTSQRKKGREKMIT